MGEILRGSARKCELSASPACRKPFLGPSHPALASGCVKGGNGEEGGCSKSSTLGFFKTIFLLFFLAKKLNYVKSWQFPQIGG